MFLLDGKWRADICLPEGQCSSIVKVDSTHKGGLGSIHGGGRKNSSWPSLPERIDIQMGL